MSRFFLVFFFSELCSFVGAAQSEQLCFFIWLESGDAVANVNIRTSHGFMKPSGNSLDKICLISLGWYPLISRLLDLSYSSSSSTFALSLLFLAGSSWFCFVSFSISFRSYFMSSFKAFTPLHVSLHIFTFSFKLLISALSSHRRSPSAFARYFLSLPMRG